MILGYPSPDTLKRGPLWTQHTQIAHIYNIQQKIKKTCKIKLIQSILLNRKQSKTMRSFEQLSIYLILLIFFFDRIKSWVFCILPSCIHIFSSCCLYILLRLDVWPILSNSHNNTIIDMQRDIGMECLLYFCFIYYWTVVFFTCTCNNNNNNL